MNSRYFNAHAHIRKLLLDLSPVEQLRKVVNGKLESGVEPLDMIAILNDILSEVGEGYEKGDVFLSELMMIGYLAKEVTSLLKPYIVEAELETSGRIVFGTVSGDIHDIGKNIVIMMLQSASFSVVDLGVDVSAERFVEAVMEEEPDVLCLSALLTSTMHEMRNVIESLENNGLRNDLKVVVGGRPITEEFAGEIGADGYALDAVKTVKVVKELVT